MRDNTYKTLLLTVLVIVLLFALHFLPSFSVFGMKLRKINILSQIITFPGDNETIDVIPKPKDPKQIQARSKNGKLLDFKEIWPKGVQPVLDYSEGNGGGMDHFYAMVDSAARHKLKGRPVRVAYYGDSFIESDILVADLREMLQSKYGGNGVGWIDAGNDLEQYKRSIKATFSGITEHMVMKKNGYNVAMAGIAERYYTTNGSASLILDGTKEYPHAATWNNSRMYFRTNGNTSIDVKTDKKAWLSKVFSGSPALQVLEETGHTSEVRYHFKGTPVLFGAALESDGGLVIDNFSMRGSTGASLADLPDGTLDDFNRQRPYDLIILQFGVNAVDANSTDKDMHDYLAKMKNVIRKFRRCFPEASILVVSTPDRGSKEGGATMPNIKALEGYQKELAAEERVGFYSLFHAMGGEGSMAKLHDKGMSSADYVHVSHGGGKIIAHQMFNSLVAGENNYLRRKKMEEEQ